MGALKVNIKRGACEQEAWTMGERCVAHGRGRPARVGWARAQCPSEGLNLLLIILSSPAPIEGAREDTRAGRPRPMGHASLSHHTRVSFP